VKNNFIFFHQCSTAVTVPSIGFNILHFYFASSLIFLVCDSRILFANMSTPGGANISADQLKARYIGTGE
jgi:hypothetical protein